MSETTRLALPLILAAQAQKHVTHNEAMAELDVLVHLALASRTILTPPPAPAEGDAYLLDGVASGSWSGQDGNIAAFINGGWQYFTPVAGWRAWVADDQSLILFDGTGWTILVGSGAVYDDLQSLGINTTADSVNRLSARTEAVLFSAIDAASGGIGDIQFKINKETETDTASLLFQSGFSGRAEMGLAGNDDFTIKVSADGASWVDALVIDKDNGKVGIGTSSPENDLHIHSIGTNSTRGVVLEQASADARGVNIIGRKSRAGGAAVDGDIAGKYFFAGHDGSDFQQSAYFGAEISGAVSAGVVPIDLIFGAGSDSFGEEVARITSAGLFSIGNITATTKLHVDGPIRCKSYTVATVPSASASGAGAQIYVSDETGGAVLAFSDGTNWRRVTDRAVVS